MRRFLALAAVALVAASPSVRADPLLILSRGPDADPSDARKALAHYAGTTLTSQQAHAVARVLGHREKDIRVTAARLLKASPPGWQAALLAAGRKGADSDELVEVVLEGARRDFEEFWRHLSWNAKAGPVVQRVWAQLGDRALDAFLNERDPGEFVAFVPDSLRSRALSALRERLKKAHRFEAGPLAYAVAFLTEDDEEGVRVIIEEIERSPGFVRSRLLKLLPGFGPAARAAVPALRRCLEEGDRDTVVQSVLVLASLGVDVAPDLSAIVRALQRPRDTMGLGFERPLEIGELKAAGRPLSGVLLGVSRTERGWDRGRYEVAEKLGYDAAILPRLRLWLRAGDLHARWMALHVLARLGAPDVALADVRPLLKSRNEDLQAAAAKVLAIAARRSDGSGEAGDSGNEPRGGKDIAVLAASLDSARGEAASTIVKALADAGPAAAPAVPALRKAYWRKDRELRLLVLAAFARIGEKAAAAVPEIEHAVAKGSSKAKFQGALALAQMGGRGRAAVPALRTMGLLGTRHRLAAAWALWVIQKDEGAIEGVREALRQGRELSLAFKVLAVMGPAARTHLPAVQRLMEKGRGPLRFRAAFAYYRLGGDVADAMEVLGSAARAWIDHRDEVLSLLEQAGPDARHARDDLERILKLASASREEKRRVAAILKKLGR